MDLPKIQYAVEDEEEDDLSSNGGDAADYSDSDGDNAEDCDNSQDLS
jgi:hypothetical protein